MALTITYELPVQGVIPPSAVIANRINEVTVTVTGDGTTHPAVITTNLGVSAADLAKGLPEVYLEPLDASFYTEAPRVVAKTADSVTIDFTGASSAEFMRVRAIRPTTAVR